MRRREFIAFLGGAAAWPLLAGAQQGERVRRIGVLMPFREPPRSDNPLDIDRIGVFVKTLEPLGWIVGRNLQIDTRWATDDADLLRKHASELVAATPDVIFTATNRAVRPLRQATRTLPIVFVSAIDPVGGGDVASMARPGGNVTGFMLYEYSISGKWLEVLKSIAPNVTRVAVLRDSDTPAGIGQFAAIQAVASPFKVELSPIDVHGAEEIERGIAAFAGEAGGGLIVVAGIAQALHRKLIVSLAARHRLPTVYGVRAFVTDGGLISYGPDLEDQYRAGAAYVDRILRGEQPAKLPVQAPTKYELVINLKTAKALGLEVPPTLLSRADEVIE